MWNSSGASKTKEETNSPNFQLGGSSQRSSDTSRSSSSIFGQPSSFNFTSPSSAGPPSFFAGERGPPSFTVGGRGPPVFTYGKTPLFPSRSDGTSEVSTQFETGFTCLRLFQLTRTMKASTVPPHLSSPSPRWFVAQVHIMRKK